MILAWSLHFGTCYEFQPLEQPLGAFLSNIAETYVGHSNWRLLYYYDLTDFYENINQYRDCLQKMEQICNHLIEVGESSQCLSLIYKHREFLNEMKIDTDYLNSLKREDQTQQNRQKRQAPLGFITKYFIKPIFGIMDENDAQELVHEINNLADNQETHHTLFDQNLSIIRKTIEITNSSLNKFQQSMYEMNTFINITVEKIKKMESEVKLHLSFSYISELATNIKIEYLTAIETIKNVIRNNIIGEYSEIMTYERLINDITAVELDLDDTRVKLLTKPRELQQSISTMVQSKIKNYSFYLKKIIPLPMRNGNEVTVLNLEKEDYLVQNATKIFIPLKESDLKLCKEISNKRLLCYIQKVAHFMDNSCESNILFGNKNEVLIRVGC